MPRSKTRTASIPPSPTSHLFATRKSGDRGARMTSERIAADLAAFHKAGGRIEKLGTTRVLTRIGSDPVAPKPANPAGRPRR